MDRAWTKEEVNRFLEKCFSNFTWRSLGLLSAYVYELGQSYREVRKLQWKDFNHDLSSVVIGKLSLPISDNLKDMTQQQKGDWDFQEYAFPYLRKSDKAYRPLNEKVVINQTKAVRDAAGLGNHITLRNLRYTALFEMYKEGVSRYELMCLTGISESKNLDRFFGIDPEAAYAAAMKRKRNIKLSLKPKEDDKV